MMVERVQRVYSVRGLNLSGIGWVMLLLSIISAGLALKAGLNAAGVILQLYSLAAMLYVGAEGIWNDLGQPDFQRKGEPDE